MKRLALYSSIACNVIAAIAAIASWHWVRDRRAQVVGSGDDFLRRSSGHSTFLYHRRRLTTAQSGGLTNTACHLRHPAQMCFLRYRLTADDIAVFLLLILLFALTTRGLRVPWKGQQIAGALLLETLQMRWCLKPCRVVSCVAMPAFRCPGNLPAGIRSGSGLLRFVRL